MFTLLILADDLTGALDSGVQFAKNGITAGVLPGPPSQEALPEDTEVLVINTNTRHSAPEAARLVIRNCMERYRAIPYKYKKTDSTLRGNIGAELEAFMEGAGIKRIPFVPAYPDLGRTTRGGIQFLREKPIHETEMAADSLNPVRESFIPGIIARQSRIPVRCFASGALSAGGEGGVMVFDSGSNGEMAAVAAALHERNLLRASAGCAGFAEALMNFIPFKRLSSPVSMTPPPAPRPLLVVSGSVNPVSLGQVRAALREGIRGFSLPAEKLCEDIWFTSAEAGTVVKQCSDALRQDGICLIGTNRALGACCTCGFLYNLCAKRNKLLGIEAQAGQTAGVHEENISGRLGKLVPGILRETPLHLAVFGGDTLLGIMDALCFDYILPIREIGPGIVLALARGKINEMFIVTKSGAFGGEGAITEIWNSLRNPVY
ncbi:MAG: four-carbon acid sugar kinase family protein [Treponema sp.]|nr:four-carbon acid sugar kinase family protein [Treponema sp.]